MSAWADLKDVGWHLANRRWRPGATVAYGARVGRDCTLGTNVQIGANARIYDSQIGDHVLIEEDNRLTHCRFEGNSLIKPGCELGHVDMGRYSYMAGTARAGRIRFGRFCSIGPDFMCGWGDHPTSLLSTSPLFYSTQKQCGTTFATKNLFSELKPVQVGHDVWIGARVFVRDGVTIGNGAIIGAGAIVVKDVPAYAVVGGVPAHVIRMRFSDNVIQELQSLSWWNWDEARLFKAQPILAQKDPRVFLDWAKSL